MSDFDKPPPPYTEFDVSTPICSSLSYNGYNRQPALCPPPPYEPRAAPGHVTVATIITPITYGAFPLNIKCPSCHQNISTSTTSVTGNFTFIAAGVLCFLGSLFAAPCICCFPFCIPSCRDVKHSCPNCKTHLGTFRRM